LRIEPQQARPTPRTRRIIIALAVEAELLVNIYRNHFSEVNQ
jgi:hypothetical protein